MRGSFLGYSTNLAWNLCSWNEVIRLQSKQFTRAELFRVQTRFAKCTFYWSVANWIFWWWKISNILSPLFSLLGSVKASFFCSVKTNQTRLASLFYPGGSIELCSLISIIMLYLRNNSKYVRDRSLERQNGLGSQSYRISCCNLFKFMVHIIQGNEHIHRSARYPGKTLQTVGMHAWECRDGKL